MSKKLSSMLVILIVYLFVIAAGVGVYLVLPSSIDLVYRILIADLVATVLVWIISLQIGRASCRERV